jgi:hypothetical protein
MSGIFDSDIDLNLLIKLNNTGFQQLIRVEDEDSSGKARQVRPPREVCDRGGSPLAVESEVFHGNQLRHIERFIKNNFVSYSLLQNLSQQSKNHPVDRIRHVF